MNRYFGVAAIVVVFGITAMANPALAQQQQQPPELDLPSVPVLGDVGWLSSTSVTTTSLAVAYGIYSMRLGGAEIAAVQTYLRANSMALHHDLHLGGGRSIGDLAALFAVADDEREAFAQLLYERRHRLVPLVEPGGVDRAATDRFVSIVVEGMLEHDVSKTIHSRMR